MKAIDLLPTLQKEFPDANVTLGTVDVGDKTYWKFFTTLVVRNTMFGGKGPAKLHIVDPNNVDLVDYRRRLTSLQSRILQPK
jgi:hypothetical protein